MCEDRQCSCCIQGRQGSADGQMYAMGSNAWNAALMQPDWEDWKSSKHDCLSSIYFNQQNAQLNPTCKFRPAWYTSALPAVLAPHFTPVTCASDGFGFPTANSTPYEVDAMQGCSFTEVFSQAADPNRLTSSGNQQVQPQVNLHGRLVPASCILYRILRVQRVQIAVVTVL